MSADAFRADALVRLVEATARADRNARIVELMETVVSSSRDLIEAEDFEVGVVDWLGRIGEATMAKRATLYGLAHHEKIDRPSLRVLAEWLNQGAGGGEHGELPIPRVIDPRGAERALEEMLSGLPVVFTSEFLGPSMRGSSGEMGAGIVVAVPIMLDGCQWGALALDHALTFEPDNHDFAVLQTAANTLGVILKRNEADREAAVQRAARLSGEMARAQQLERSTLQLQHRERLLFSVTEATRLLLVGDDFDAAVKGMLASIGEVLGLQWAGLVRNIQSSSVEASEPCWDVSHSWSSMDHEMTTEIENLTGAYPTREVHDRLGSGETVVVKHELRDDRPHCFGEPWKAGAVLFVPVRWTGHWWGCLILADGRDNRSWSSYEISSLETAAACVSAALSRQAVELQRLAELAETNLVLQRTLDVLATEPRLDRALGHVLQVMSEQLGAGSAALWKRTSDMTQFRVSVIYHQGEILVGGRQAELAGWPCDADLKWKEHVYQRRPIVYDVERLREDSPTLAAFFDAFLIRGLLGIPLILGEDVIGSVTVRFEEPRVFSERQLELVQSLTHQATLVIRLQSLSEQALAEERQAAALAERNRLAGEIHDALAQSFVGVLVQAQAAQEKLSRGQAGALAAYIDRIQALARDGLTEARRALLALRPPTLEDMSLSRGLRILAEKASVPGRIRCDVVDTLGNFRVRPDLEHALFRITQEALQNVLRHAEASHVVIVIDKESDALTLVVEDDGVGIEESQLVGRGGGLRSMRERAEACGGECVISRRTPNRGSRVRVSVPLHDEANSQ